MAYLPLFDEAQIDVTISHAPAVLFVSHAALEQIELVKSPYKFTPYSFGSIIGRIYKKSFVSGNTFRIRSIGDGFLAFVNRKIEREGLVQAIWNGVAEEIYFHATQSEHPAEPARLSKPWRQCLLISAATKEEILAALDVRSSVDQLIIVIVTSDLTIRAREEIPEDIEVLFAGDTNDVYFAALKACQSGHLDRFEFVGICLHHRIDRFELSTGTRDGLYNPSRWDLELLAQSKSKVRSIMSVFESDSNIATVESPLTSIFRKQFADRLNILPDATSRLPRSAWFRMNSLKGILPSVMADVQNKHIQSNLQPNWPALLEQSLSTAGFAATTKLWTDLRDGEPAAAADYRIIRPLECPEAKKVCLFVCFAPNGELRPHAFHFMRELRRMGYLVFALAANDRSDLETLDPGPDTCDGLAARENIGYDFALWAAALLHDPRLFAAKELLLVNDSLVGPLLPLDRLFENIQKAGGDIVGLVDSYQHNYHCQSFFFVLRSSALTSSTFFRFVSNIKSHSDKNLVIREYERKFYSEMVAGGISIDVEFKTAKLGKGRNPTVEHWRELLSLGFPFVKLQVVQINPLADDLGDMMEHMDRYGSEEYILKSICELKAYSIRD